MGALGRGQETAADVVPIQDAVGRIYEPALLVVGEALLLTLGGVWEEEHAAEADTDGEARLGRGRTGAWQDVPAVLHGYGDEQTGAPDSS